MAGGKDTRRRPVGANWQLVGFRFKHPQLCPDESLAASMPAERKAAGQSQPSAGPTGSLAAAAAAAPLFGALCLCCSMGRSQWLPTEQRLPRPLGPINALGAEFRAIVPLECPCSFAYLPIPSPKPTLLPPKSAFQNPSPRNAQLVFSLLSPSACKRRQTN